MSLKRWIPTFLGFPLGGFLAIETVGSMHDVPTAAAGGLVAGAAIGAAQWLALRPRGAGPGWAVATALAGAAGTALAAAVTGAGHELGDVLAAGAITGAAVGAAQAPLLARLAAAPHASAPQRAASDATGRHAAASRTSAPRVAAAWIATTAAGWTLGWLATFLTIVDIERGYHVFGSSGAITATLLTGLVLRQVLGAPAAAPALGVPQPA